MHAVEASSDFVNFLRAMEHWAHFLQSGDPKFAVEVSEQMMNVLDDLYVTTTDLSKWLETPEISQEFSKQIAFLSDGAK